MKQDSPTAVRPKPPAIFRALELTHTTGGVKVMEILKVIDGSTACFVAWTTVAEEER